MKSRFCGGEPHHFLQVFILRNFKSNGFASADSKGLVEAFFLSACSKGFASFGQRQGVTMLELFFSAKLLVDFALHVTSVVIERQGKTQASQAGPRLAEKSGHSKAMSDSHPKEP